MKYKKMYTKFFKRTGDFLFSSIGLILLFPFFLIVTILLAIANQGSPFFIQKRPGLHGKIFRIIKFKTMNDKKDDLGHLLSDGERLTRIGAIVRKTSLDEIPQLFNVLIGQMSLIGPRPLLTQYMHLYSPYQNRRHEVKPGITGWAQVNGRNAIDWDTKFDLDVYYVKHISFLFDLKIFIKTIRKVIVPEGINAENSATNEPFSGNTNVYLFGAGGHSSVLIDTLMSESKYEVIAVIDDNPVSEHILGVPVKANTSPDFLNYKNCIISIGDNTIRKKIALTLKTNFVMTIHPSAVVSKFAKIGNGTQIMASAVINPESKIGNHCIINTGAIIEHHCELGDYVHISPNATLGGNVTVGEKTQIGINASVIPGVVIGKNVTIGAGSVILKDVPDHAVVVGVPGKIIKYNNE